jgi:hypothetical protein
LYTLVLLAASFQVPSEQKMMRLDMAVPPRGWAGNPD